MLPDLLWNISQCNTVMQSVDVEISSYRSGGSSRSKAAGVWRHQAMRRARVPWVRELSLCLSNALNASQYSAMVSKFLVWLSDGHNRCCGWLSSLVNNTITLLLSPSRAESE